MSEPEVLHGGIANAGAVVRIGDEVFRPTNAHTPTIHRFLLHLAAHGKNIAPQPTAAPGAEREQLRFVPGDVAIPPYPEWAQRDEALRRRPHLSGHCTKAHARFRAAKRDSWSSEMADPAGGPVICHNDVCLENVVFRNGVAVALLDFDFAAPGRPAHDVAAFARMCVPIDDEVNRRKLGWLDADLPRRLRVVADAYGLETAGRGAVIAALDNSIRHGGEFVRRHAEAGEPGFVAMWEEIGGMTRFDRRHEWWARQHDSFTAAID